MKNHKKGLDWGQVNAAVNRLLSALGEDVEDGVRQLADANSSTLRCQIAWLVKNRGLASSTSHLRAGEVISYIDVNQSIRAGIAQHMHATKHLGLLDVVPFSEQTLARYKDTHILIACPAISIFQMERQTRLKILPEAQKLPILNEKPQSRFILFRKKLDGADRRVFVGDETPHLAHLVYANLVYRWAIGGNAVLGGWGAHYQHGGRPADGPYATKVYGPEGQWIVRYLPDQGDKPAIIGCWPESK